MGKSSPDMFGDNKQQTVFILQGGDKTQLFSFFFFYLKAASYIAHKCLRGKKEESLSGPVRRGKQFLPAQRQWQILPLLGKGNAEYEGRVTPHSQHGTGD